MQEEITAARADGQLKLNIGLKYQKRTKELTAQINETKETHGKAVADLQAQVDSLTAQIEKLNEEISSAKRDAASKLKEADDVKQEVATLKTSLAEKETALKEALASAENAEASPPVAPVSPQGATAEVHQALEQAKQRISELESQLSTTTKARDDAIAEQARLQAASTESAKLASADDALLKDLVGSNAFEADSSHVTEITSMIGRPESTARGGFAIG